MKHKKKLCLIVGILLVLLCVAALIGLMRFREHINNTETLSSYRLYYAAEESENAEYIKTLAKKANRITLYKSTSKSHLYLYLSSSPEVAGSLGYSFDQFTEDAFILARNGNVLYVLGASREGFSRGAEYLLHHLVDSEGMLLLPQWERYCDPGSKTHTVYLPDGTSLSACSVYVDAKADAALATTLSYYMTYATGAVPTITETVSDNPTVSLLLDSSLADAYRVTYLGNRITIAGGNNKALEQGIYDFANTALGWMFAGTERERLNGHNTTLSLALLAHDTSDAWIAEREPIVVLWDVQMIRGFAYNQSASDKNQLLSYSDEELYEYVRMMKYAGYTGLQVTDICAAWASGGGYEHVQDRIRFIADAAHSMGMKMTLWVWGAEFTGYGWVDETVVYREPDLYEFSYQSEKALATFEKYYNIYAELADCSDRVIAHYYDPGNLNLVTQQDVAYFSRMLMDKFKAINPNIDFGVNCYVSSYFDRNILTDALGTDITLYEGGQRSDLEEYDVFRSFCRNNGVRLGTWAWYTCEMETDQLPFMAYNATILQSVYRTAREYDSVCQPSYWSEMDANHVLNIFSLYAASQLLVNPDADTDTITQEIANAFVGEADGQDFAKVLRLIEKARSGYTWDEYFYSTESNVITSETYPAEEILSQATECISILEGLLDKELSVTALPLPIDTKELIRLILPQVTQIKEYAEFRIGFRELQDMAFDNASDAVLLDKIESISKPVSEYNTTVGLWGQVEARAQFILLWDFCEAHGLEMPVNSAYKYLAKNRIYQYFVTYQKGHSEPVLQYTPYYQYGIAYGEEATIAFVQELIEEGVLAVDASTGGVYLADWEHYRFAFN